MSDSSVSSATPAVALAAEIVEREAWLDLFDAAPHVARVAFGLSSARIGGMGLLASRGIPITEFNRAMGVDTQVPIAEGDLLAATDWLDSHAAQGWAFQVAPDSQPRSNLSTVEPLGFSPSGSGWAKFVRRVTGPAPTQLPAGVEVHIADAATATSFGATVQSGFGVAPECAEWFAALVGRPGWCCFFATVGGKPAAAAAMFIGDGAAWSGMSTTLPDYRGRGLQSALIKARLNEAAARGVAWVTSETGQPSVEDEAGFSSYRNQKRGGFERAYIRLNLKRAE
jgi:GNAT superfamily N-acetyltransferase